MHRRHLGVLSEHVREGLLGRRLDLDPMVPLFPLVNRGRVHLS